MVQWHNYTNFQLKVMLKVIPQTTVEYAFPVVLEKLFCSILNHRLLDLVKSLDIPYKCQIGFQSNNRTADHVLTLRTLIDKYVHGHQTKVFSFI